MPGALQPTIHFLPQLLTHGETEVYRLVVIAQEHRPDQVLALPLSCILVPTPITHVQTWALPAPSMGPQAGHFTPRSLDFLLWKVGICEGRSSEGLMR